MSLNDTITALGNSIVNLINSKEAVYFTNVADLKAATRLSAGQIVCTKGYYAANDGGQARYLIRATAEGDVDDGGSILTLTAEGLVAELIVENGIVNVKQFGAKGDGVHDDTTNIQAAINTVTNTTLEKIQVSAGGGGTVYMSSGKYKITDTLLLGNHVRLIGTATTGFAYPEHSDKQWGTLIIADFENLNKWAISTATYIYATGERVGYRDVVYGSSFDQGKINACYGVTVENIYIKCKTNIYGGIRIQAAPNAKLTNVGVEGSDVGFMVNCSWGNSLTKLFSLTYLYGVTLLQDTNDTQLNGYFNRKGSKTINNDNRIGHSESSDWDTTWDLKDISSCTFGVLVYYANGTSLQNVITERWHIGRHVHQSKYTDISGWVENCSVAVFSQLGGYCHLIGLHGYNPNVSYGYLLGSNTKTTFDKCSAYKITNNTNVRTSADSSVNWTIISNDPDRDGWNFCKRATYVGAPNNVLYVSSDGDPNNVGCTGAYNKATTMSEAITRINGSNKKDWTIYIKAGDTVTFTGKLNVYDKKIKVARWGSGEKPTIIFDVLYGSESGGIYKGYPQTFFACYNTDIYLENLNLEFKENSYPQPLDEHGIFYLRTGHTRIAITGCNINLQTGWAIIQGGYNLPVILSFNLNDTTVSGTNNACIQWGDAGVKPKVMYSYSNCTISQDILNRGTDGWVYANIIS